LNALEDETAGVALISSLDASNSSRSKSPPVSNSGSLASTISQCGSLGGTPVGSTAVSRGESPVENLSLDTTRIGDTFRSPMYRRFSSLCMSPSPSAAEHEIEFDSVLLKAYEELRDRLEMLEAENTALREQLKSCRLNVNAQAQAQVALAVDTSLSALCSGLALAVYALFSAILWGILSNCFALLLLPFCVCLSFVYRTISLGWAITTYPVRFAQEFLPRLKVKQEVTSSDCRHRR
jgi:hypothetical protein